MQTKNFIISGDRSNSSLQMIVEAGFPKSTRSAWNFTKLFLTGPKASPRLSPRKLAKSPRPGQELAIFVNCGYTKAMQLAAQQRFMRKSAWVSFGVSLLNSVIVTLLLSYCSRRVLGPSFMDIDLMFSLVAFTAGISFIGYYLRRIWLIPSCVSLFFLGLVLLFGNLPAIKLIDFLGITWPLIYAFGYVSLSRLCGTELTRPKPSEQPTLTPGSYTRPLDW